MSRPPRSEPAHDSARLHVQGRALYIEDLPRLEGELTLELDRSVEALAQRA